MQSCRVVFRKVVLSKRYAVALVSVILLVSFHQKMLENIRTQFQISIVENVALRTYISFCFVRCE